MNQSNEKSEKKNTLINDDPPILKSNWERFRTHVDLNKELAATLLAPVLQVPIDELSILSEGCANSNFKLTFHSGHPPLILRIYVRDSSALARELQLHAQLNNQIPVPTFLYHDDSCTHIAYPYAVMEWVDGILMREVILSKNEHAIRACAREAGKYLAVLRGMKLSRGGFFQPDSSIRPFNQDEDYLPYIHFLLRQPTVRASLGPSSHAAVSKIISNEVHHLPHKDDANLTHADYDPANMLVRQIAGEWQISAILDWEFALASTYLLDIGLFLRYSHLLPACYESAFIASVEKYSGALPPDWRLAAKLMDLLCLLQLLYYNPRDQRPHLHDDVLALIKNIIAELLPDIKTKPEY
jgi:Ser/Thr protein kinase RdoA (MazF antagonist)